MKIGILTTFGGSDQAYSLVNVVATQLRMLQPYHPALFVCPSFTGEGVYSDRVTDIRRTIDGEAKAEQIIPVLEPLMADIDIMICHDIVFLSQHTEWGKAICDIATRRPDVAWVHWQHSRGDGHVNNHPNNSWFAYPNQGDLAHCAEVNSTSIERVRYIPHPLDFDYLGWGELALRIAEDTGYPFADVSGILPARLDRHKQVEKAVRLFAGLKKAGRSVCFLIADAYATGERFIQYKRDVETIAREQGLGANEFAFLGERYEECKYGTPRQTVKALYEMGNLFVQPSNAETSSLVAMEAALAGNMVIINADFPPIAHLYKRALALPFGSVLEDTKYYRHMRTADGSEVKVEDPQQYWDDQARQTVIPAMDSQLVLQVKRQQLQDRWPSHIFKDYMEPLLKEIWTAYPRTDSANGDPDVTAIITTIDNLPMLQRQVPILQAECDHVIIVNNGSIDGTAQWLEETPMKGVSYINRQNCGAGPGRNAGIDLWANSTPYVLFVDGGILPPIGGVPALKDYLMRHPETDVISPEVASCFTTDEAEATLRVSMPVPEQVFWQRCLSSTAYCMTNRRAWDGIRFSEEGPFGEPGWGVDDNEMAYRWDVAEIRHDEFLNSTSGWKLYRRAGGSHKRLFDETGIWPTQYGSVYEKRNVKTFQDWRTLHGPLYGYTGIPRVSFVIDGIPMPIFARVVKYLHDNDRDCEILVGDYDPEVTRWLDTFALRWPWGDCTIDPDGKVLRRGDNYPEELWSGDVVRNRGPLSPTVKTVTMDDVAHVRKLVFKENNFFHKLDPQQARIFGYEIPPEWWSRVYEYSWALNYVDLDRAMRHSVVADMGCGYEQRPFKDVLSEICVKVYAVDSNRDMVKLQPHENMELVVADFTQRIEAIPDGSLDRVFCISVIEELGDSLPAALREFERCLKPGGLCLLTADVQYDMEKETPYCGGIDPEYLRRCIDESGLRPREPMYFDKADAVYSEQHNLCCYHCVLVKS